MIRKNMARAAKVLFVGAFVILSFGAAGEICGGFLETTTAAFGSSFPDNKSEDVQKVMSALGKARSEEPRPQNALGTPAVVMVTDDNPTALVAWDVRSGKQIWKTVVPIISEVTIGGDLVIFQSGSNVVVYSLSSGRELWTYKIEDGWDYHGSAVDDGIVVISVGVGGEEAGSYANGKLVGLSASSGFKKWDNGSGGGLLGEPSTYKGMVFVPWDRQKIAVLDVKSGEEICRLRADDFSISFVSAGPAGVFYGAGATTTTTAGIIRFNKSSISGTKEGSTIFVPELDPVPGNPGFKRDAFAKPVYGHSATTKISFHWKPEVGPQKAITMSDDRFYLHYWRYVLAFDSTSSEILWVFRSEKDLESMTTLQGGVLAIDTGGRLLFIDAQSGAEIWSQETGLKAVTAAFDAGGFKPKPASATKPPSPLIGLRKMIWDKDNRMLPIRSYAVGLMASFEVPQVTRDLLEVYSDASVPEGLRDAVVRALRKRTVGSEYLIEALDMRYDFLENTQSPPMDVVAQALVNMNERSAIPALLDHLTDHETDIKHLKDIAIAIRELGDPMVVDTLRQFLILYHADSSFVGNEDVLFTVAETIVKFGGDQEKDFVSEIREDSQTLIDLKPMLVAFIKPDAAALAEAKSKVEMEAKAKAEAEAKAKAEKTAKPQILASLSRDHIRQIMVTNQTAFEPCIQDALSRMPTLQKIRLRFVIAGATGRASKVQVLPNNIPGLRECLESSIAKIEFPQFRNSHQVATYSIETMGSPPPGWKPKAPGKLSPGQLPRPERRRDPDSFQKRKEPPPSGHDPDSFR